MSISKDDIYISEDAIINLTDVELIRRIEELNRNTRESMNASKTADLIWYDSLNKELQKWQKALSTKINNLMEVVQKSPFRPNPKTLEDRIKKLKRNQVIIDELVRDYQAFAALKNVEQDNDDGDALFFGRKLSAKTKYRGGDQKTTPPSQGESYTVKPAQRDGSLDRKEADLRNRNIDEVIQNYDKSSDKMDKQASVNIVLEKAKQLGSQDGTAAGATQKFIEQATYEDLVKELDEIKDAMTLILQADKDQVIKINEARTQEGILMKIKRDIENSQKYKAGEERINEDVKKRGFGTSTKAPQIELKDGDKLDLPTLSSPPEPEQVEAEPQQTKQGQVGDIPLTGSNLVQEANNYIAEINKIPAFRLNSQMINIRQELQNAIKEPIDQEKLRIAVQKARQFFQNIDQNLNRIPDRNEMAGQAIDQGLEDMKKIEEQNKQAKEAKTKLTDLRPEAKEGEEERVKKNFNKDVLELKTANDVLKSQVNIQRETIKVLKESIEQKLKKENDSMLSGIAPVFRNYLNLDIENVVQEHEAQEQVYYSVI